MQEFNELNRNLIINVNGELKHRSQATISVFDSAVQAVDTVYEDLRVYGGQVFQFIEHIERLLNSAKAFHSVSVGLSRSTHLPRE